MTRSVEIGILRVPGSIGIGILRTARSLGIGILGVPGIHRNWNSKDDQIPRDWTSKGAGIHRNWNSTDGQIPGLEF